MAPKVERFEMRLDEDVLTRVDTWRAQQGQILSRAEAMRRLVEIGLAKNAGDTVTLSDGEKLLALMMRDIYKHLKLERGEIDPDFVSEVIFGGHYWAPKWDMQGVFHDYEDDPRNVKFVVDILDMWSFVERGYSKLSEQDKALVENLAAPFGKYVAFSGFDGNNETTYMSITRFLIDKMQRFTEFKGRDLNSHAPKVREYAQMFAVFEPMRKELVGVGLNATQIASILKAGSR